MTTVHKYVLEQKGDQDIDIPCGNVLYNGEPSIHILHADWQHGFICVWARVDPRGTTRKVRFHVRTTGQPMGEAELGAEHIGTVLVGGGAIVFHVFVRTDWQVKA